MSLFELLTTDQFLTLGIVAIFIGMSKTGVSGANMIAVPILAMTFGGKVSSGLMLPILCIADIFGVLYYNRHTEWTHLKKILPSAAVGVGLGTWIGDYINDDVFISSMGAIIIISLGIMIWMEKYGKQSVPTHPLFAISCGILGGVTTMIGNLAGSVMALYLLSMRLPKNNFIGTAAWFFLIINWFKVPFHVFAWKTITIETFLLDALTIPLVAIGAVTGYFIVKKIPEKYYRIFIMIMTGIAAVAMLI